MMRTRLLLSCGVVLVVMGVAVAAIALTWFATIWGPGPHVYEPDGPLSKQLSMASFSAVVGAAAAVSGVALGVAGLVLRKKTPAP